MIQRAHDMPFGAQITDGGVRFRLWSPSAKKVELLLGDRAAIAMQDAGGGWRELELPDARAGDDYAYRLPDGLVVPDPASRWQPANIGGRSRVVDPRAYAWADADWRGRAWPEAVLYEAHIGTATPQGTYRAFADELDRLADLGVTAIEIMPLAQAPGSRNWGYDGVLLFAPACTYGSPDDLKALVDCAHARGLMVILDVVYNHFGPSGNFLHAYAEAFFTQRHQTPWGAGLNFDGADGAAVRAFFVHNALYWIEEFHVDGLRLDAVHAILDDNDPHILVEIAQTIRAHTADRQVHLILENDANQSRWLDRQADGSARLYTAQWNDDAHHCWHTLLTGENDGYYADFAPEAPARLARALAEGFVYQGDPRLRDGEARGEPSAHLPPTAFIDFLQNHDQVGNRAFGDRIDALADPEKVAVARAVLLLCAHIPMLFMGEEWASRRPFLYFVDFHDDPALSDAVREGRRREFAAFETFATSTRELPDPTAAETFEYSCLDPQEPQREPQATALGETRRLLALRKTHVIPLISSPFIEACVAEGLDRGLVDVTWRFAAGALRVAINVGDAETAASCGPEETVIYHSDEKADASRLRAWNAFVTTRGPA